jgi:hypothetical protein
MAEAPGLIRRAKNQWDTSGDIVGRTDGELIRRAKSQWDTSGDIVGRTDGELIRRAKSQWDTSGEIVARVEGLPAEVRAGGAAVMLGLLP